MPSRFAVRHLLLSACLALGAAFNAAAERDGAPLQPVRVQLKWTHQFQFAGYYAAVHQGFYRDAGFDVSLLEYRPGAAPIEQLIGGRAEYAVADSGVLLYRSTGVPLVALAAIFQQSPSILLTTEASGVRELTDLRGKRVMLLGGYLNAELMSMLEAVGLRSEDFTLLPADPDVRALMYGRTDAYNAYTTNEPYRLELEGIAYRKFAPSDYGVDFYGDILITTESLLKSDPEGVRRFREATLKGWRHAVQHPDEVVDVILAHYNTQARSREHLLFEAREAIRLILPNVVPIGYMNEERWKRIEATFRARGQTTQAVDMRGFLHRPDEPARFLDAVRRYRLEITATLAAIIALLLMTHILRLRAQVRSRTFELENARQRAEAEARTDALTGLPNRRYFHEALRRDLARAEREDVPLALLAIDVDHFKTVNDRFGHPAGDEALRRTATTLLAHVRGSDIAARIGGEEFALACLNAHPEHARQLAERLRQAVEDMCIEYDGVCFSITASIGLAYFQPGEDMEALSRKADQMLYDAKANGRNRVCEWPEVSPTHLDLR